MDGGTLNQDLDEVLGFFLRYLTTKLLTTAVTKSRFSAPPALTPVLPPVGVASVT